MHGYKKTGVNELCRQASISKGAFYLFYASKEALFCEVLCSVQEQMRKEASRILKERPNKHGVAKALKHIYREYDRYHFLCDADSMDFTILKNRLSEEEVRKIKASEQLNRQLFFQPSTLKMQGEGGSGPVRSLHFDFKYSQQRRAFTQSHGNV